MRRAVALVLVGCAVVQFGAALAVHLFEELGPGGTVFLRLLLAALVLLALWRPRLRGRSWPELRLAAAFGIVLGLMNWSFYESLDRIPLGAAVTLEFVGPLAVGLLGSRRPRDLVWIALAAGGVVLLADPFGAGGLEPAGVALAFAAGACWGTYILLSARTGAVWPGGSGLAVAMAVGALVALPAGVTQGGSDLLRPELVAAGLAVALASSVIPYSLELEALRTLPEHVFGVLMSLEPGIAALAGFLVLSQGLGLTDVVAIGLVAAASIGVTLTAARQAQAPPPLVQVAS